MLTVPTQHSPLLSFASAEGLFWAHEGCEKFQGQNPPPKTKSPAIGCSRKRTHLLSKKARTILDRIGLSSRSGTLLKFSLLGSRKERHREKGEKRKQMSDSTFPELYFLSRADTARTVHRRVWNAPRPAASSTKLSDGRSREDLEAQRCFGESDTRPGHSPPGKKAAGHSKNCTPFQGQRPLEAHRRPRGETPSCHPGNKQ